DYIFSYLSQWIIPGDILNKAKIAAINWHPGSPDYPGIGCTNFALYNKEVEFGITCHHMLSKVDTGKVIEVLRFPVTPNETVLSLTQKAYSNIFQSFIGIIDRIEKNESLPISNENWTRKPYTRKELNELCEIDLSMNKEEVELRIKSTTYDRPWAQLKFHGYNFKLEK
ncbi:formyltransferase family protein, partial [Lishizhenia sp.]|uniref:formyltransferase family protein n=1 Tax=Lishizhenia sp. TaxID=2497594 RepID=UPI00299EDD68